MRRPTRLRILAQPRQSKHLGVDGPCRGARVRWIQGEHVLIVLALRRGLAVIVPVDLGWQPGQRPGCELIVVVGVTSETQHVPLVARRRAVRHAHVGDAEVHEVPGGVVDPARRQRPAPVRVVAARAALAECREYDVVFFFREQVRARRGLLRVVSAAQMIFGSIGVCEELRWIRRR